MSYYVLNEELIFPDPCYADEDGLLAIGGDLSPERLLNAYSNGIFPWPTTDYALLWYCPDPRPVLLPQDFRVSKSLRQTLRNKAFEVRFDTCFADVINRCASVKRGHETGTWILPEIKSAYTELHYMGFAHSVETFLHGELVGGLYGLSLGGVFFGESMFHTEPDASKVALYHLVQRVKAWNFDFIDIQQYTPHLASLGAIEIMRTDFLSRLERSIQKPTLLGSWTVT